MTVEEAMPVEQKKMGMRDLFTVFLQLFSVSVAAVLICLYLAPRMTVVPTLVGGILFAWFWPNLVAAPAPKVTRNVCVLSAIAANVMILCTADLKGFVLVLGCVPLVAFIGEMLRGIARSQMVMSLSITVLGAFIAGSGAVWILFSEHLVAIFAFRILGIALTALIPAALIVNSYMRTVLSLLTPVVVAAISTLVFVDRNIASGGNSQWCTASLIMFIIVLCVLTVALVNLLAVTSCRSFLQTSQSPNMCMMVPVGLVPVLLAAMPIYVAAKFFFNILGINW